MKMIIKNSRKRVHKVTEWDFNKQKQNITDDLTYISKSGKPMAGKVMKPQCNCRLTCFNKLSHNRVEIHTFYWNSAKAVDVKTLIYSC